MDHPPQFGVALTAAERQSRRRAKLKEAAWIAAERQRRRAELEGAAPTPTVNKPFPRQARSRARLTAKNAKWLRESGSFFDEAANDRSWDQMDPKAYWLLREILGSSPD